MKKIAVISVLFALIATPGFAAELRSKLESCCNASLSAGVIGFYFANDGGGVNASKFVVSSAHPGGDKAFATGSDLSAIYVKSVTDHSPLVSSDILSTKPTNFDSESMLDILGTDYKPQ